MRKQVALCLVGAVVVQGCSSRPREFVPTLAAAPDQAKFAADYSQCRELMVTGKLDSRGRLASAATAGAAAAAAGTAGAVAASSAGLYAGAAIASATIVALPIVALGGAFGMAKAKQKSKEAAIRDVMTVCMQQRGYAITSWVRAPKGQSVPGRPSEQ